MLLTSGMSSARTKGFMHGKKSWHENFMHENFIFMHVNEIAMHENKYYALKMFVEENSMHEKCTAQFPMKVFEA